MKIIGAAAYAAAGGLRYRRTSFEARLNLFYCHWPPKNAYDAFATGDYSSPYMRHHCFAMIAVAPSGFYKYYQRRKMMKIDVPARYRRQLFQPATT